MIVVWEESAALSAVTSSEIAIMSDQYRPGRSQSV